MGTRVENIARELIAAHKSGSDTEFENALDALAGAVKESEASPERFVLESDYDGHWYVVPKNKLSAFYAWLESAEVDEPYFAVRVSGPSLVSFTNYEIE